MRYVHPEVIRAITPIVIAISGSAIGLCVVMNQNVTGEKATGAFGLAGTALAGAAGLAQSVKTDSSPRRGKEANSSTN